MKKNKFLMDLSLLLFAVTGFFYFLIGNGYYMLILSIIPICLYIINAVVSMDKENYTWVVFIIFLWVSTLVSVYSTASYKYMLVILILFLAKVIFESVYGWHTKMSKIFFFFAAIHTCAVVLCLFIPDTIKSIVDTLYTGEALDTYTELFEREAYAGIAGQTGYAAFFATIFFGTGVCGLINGDKKLKNLILILVGIVALSLTLKRSYFVANVIAIIFTFVIYNKGNKKFANNLLLGCIVASVVYYILINIPASQNFLEKTNLLRESGDVTNGRMYLWKETYKLWLKNPVFGQGIGTLPSYYGLSTHNIYLQVLAEAGVFGFIGLIVALISSLVKSCNIYRDILSDTKISVKEKKWFSLCVYMQVVFIIYGFTGNPMYGISFLLIDIFFIACIKSYAKNNN